jgi:hypothetical protein
MDHVKEFDFFSFGKSRQPEESKLEAFIKTNYSKIVWIFSHIGEGLTVTDINVETDGLFNVDYDVPNEEMPTRISYLMEEVNKRMSTLIGDPNLEWRFGYDSPFIIRFILSKPL